MRLFLINGRFLFTNQHQRVYLCYQRTFLYQLANGNGQRTTGVLINHVLLWFIALWLAILEPAIGVWRGQLIRYRLWSRDKHKINTLFISILAVHPVMMWITCRTSGGIEQSKNATKCTSCWVLPGNRKISGIYFDETKNFGDTHFLFYKNRIRFFDPGWFLRNRDFELKKILRWFLNFYVK